VDETRSLTLRYTPSARSDVAEILDYLGNQSSQARRIIEAEFQNVFDLLSNYPIAGTATTQPRLRRRVVTGYPYVIFYRVQSSILVIVAVRHTSR